MGHIKAVSSHRSGFLLLNALIFLIYLNNMSKAQRNAVFLRRN